MEGGGELGLEGVLVDHALHAGHDLGLDFWLVHPFLGRKGLCVVRVVYHIAGGLAVSIKLGNLRWILGEMLLEIARVPLHQSGHEGADLVDR